MKLKVKSFNIAVGKPILYLHKKDAELLTLHPGDYAEIIAKNKSSLAIVDIVEEYFKKGEAGLSKKITKEMKIKSGDKITIKLADPPKSRAIIRKKLKCKEYTKKDLLTIIKDIVDNAISEAEISYFISTIQHCGMSFKETKFLTEAMYETGKILKWNSKIIADKHSIGGVAGNRTTPIVVSICAAAGITMPKTSSRAITSAAGTADVVEVLVNVDFPLHALKEIVNKAGACLAWGGSLGLAPADDKLIQVEKALNVDPEPQLLASILSKKIAAGSTHVLIDIPYGEGAKVSKSHALRLKKSFLKLGKSLGLKIEAVLTDGSQPIGNGIGPNLEMIDVIRVLKRKNPPLDLEKKAIMLAGKILEMTGKAKKGTGNKKAKKLLDSRKAFAKFEEILKAQRGKIKKLKESKFIHTIKSSKAGIITKISNKKMNSLARFAGSPNDKTAGICLSKHKKDKIRKGEKLMEIHSESKTKLKQALDFFQETKPITIS